MDFLNRLQTDELSDNAFLQELCSLVSDSLAVEDAGRIEHAKSTTDFLMSKINFSLKVKVTPTLQSSGFSTSKWLKFVFYFLKLSAPGTGNCI